MLERAFIYREAFAALALEDKNFVWNLEAEEWVKIEKIVALLRPFSEITTLFSGTTYPTANLYFANVWNIELTLLKEMNNDEEYIRDMAKSMKEKFNKYWDCYNMVLAFGVILDPQYKLDYVRFCYMKLNADNYMVKTNNVIESMEKLFQEYSDDPVGVSSINQTSTRSTTIEATSRNVIDAVSILSNVFCKFLTFSLKFVHF